MKVSQLVQQFPEESKLTAKPRPYFNHAVEMKALFTAEERAQLLEQVGLRDGVGDSAIVPDRGQLGLDVCVVVGQGLRAKDNHGHVHRHDGDPRGLEQLFTVAHCLKGRRARADGPDAGLGQPLDHPAHAREKSRGPGETRRYRSGRCGRWYW